MVQKSAATFSLPEWLQIVLAFLGVAGFVLTAIGAFLAIRWSPSRANETAKKGGQLRSIRYWRPSQYSLALGHLQEFSERLEQRVFYTGFERGHVTETDLVRWITQLALTCAAQMVPQSLGKANLFRVSSIERDQKRDVVRVNVYSSEFVGVFSASQLVNPFEPTRLRNLHWSEVAESADEYPAALQCIPDRLPTIQSLRRRKAVFDAPERSFGATHIVAIPLLPDLEGPTSEDQVVSITVDLKFGRLTGWRLDHREFQNTDLFRRAQQLSKLLSGIPQLSDPSFLPLIGPPVNRPLPLLPLARTEPGVRGRSGEADVPGTA